MMMVSLILLFRYLNHPLTHEFYKELLDLASRNVVVNKNTMVRITKELLCTIHLKNGHRQEIWSSFTLGHYFDAVQGPDAAFPYVDTRKARAEEGKGKVLDTEWGEVYVRDPHRADPGVIDDPLGDDPVEDEPRNLRVGKCTVVKAHKTGKNYPAYVYFSLYDVVWIRAYEVIRFNFLNSIGKNPLDKKQAFFINSAGGSLIGRNRGLDWTRFMMINQCGTFKGHTARKIMSDYIKKQDNSVLAEGKSSRVPKWVPI